MDIVQRLRPTGEADPNFTPYRVVHPHQIRHIAADSRAIWILRTTEGQFDRLARLGLDGTADPLLPPSGLELGLIGSLGGWKSGRATDFEPMPEGGLLLRTVFGVNGHRRLRLAKLDVTAPLARVEVAPHSARVAENAGTVAVHLVRAGDLTAAWTLRWSTEDSTARAGADYQAASGEVTFPAGGSSATITLTVLDNAAFDEDRSLRLRFTTVPEGAALPLVEVTEVNEDLGFVPGTFRALPNGTWTVRPTGHLDGGRPADTSVFLEMASDLGIVENEQWLHPVTDWDVTRNEGEYPRRFLRLRRE